MLRAAMNKKKGGAQKTTVALDYLHILECVKAGYEKAFSTGPISKALDMAGYVPFTRRSY
eukprot:COSAG05_NODE_1987_length_3740_cov_9.368305_2_plen_60_part_00